MADHPTSFGGRSGHLDASGPREVVYCHQCHNEWYQDEHGLECPRCEGNITEIVRPGEDDPRPNIHPPSPPPLHDHNPWADTDTSDNEEADIEEHINHGPDGSTIFTRTTRTGPRTFTTTRTTTGNRSPMDGDHPDHVMRDFQDIIGNLMGPGFRRGASGRSGPETLFHDFNSPMGGAGGFRSGSFRIGGDGGPNIVGGRVTFTTTRGGLHPRDPNGAQPGGPPMPEDIATYATPQSPSSPGGRRIHILVIRTSPDQLTRIIGNLLGGPIMNPPPNGAGGMPPMGGLQGLLAAMLNPANARSGDAVYSQEALDQIISTLMEQHPTSNAPGPAPPESIAALPKKKLDEKMLGPEGKGECSVCMDDVKTGDEVVVLPCSHWFHEACAAAWLGEHNTCPICRKGIEGEASGSSTPQTGRRASSSASTSRNEPRASRLSAMRPRMGRETSARNERNERNEARLNYIRSGAGLDPQSEPTSSTPQDDYHTPMPGAFQARPGEREERRGNTSGSDRSRESRRSSQSGNSGNGSSGGPFGWLRDRFSSNRRND